MGQLTFKRKLLFSFLTFLGFLVLAEVSVRLWDIVRGANVHARGLGFFWGHEQDRFLDYRAKPNIDVTFANGSKFDTNSQGFRDVEIPIEPERERRLIICVGESSTWGVGSSDRDHAYPRFVQEELNRSSAEPFVVMNAGFPGYTTVHNLRLVQLRLLKYKPEALLYMGFYNDCEEYIADLGNEPDFNFYPREIAILPDTWVNRTLMRSSLFTYISTKLWPFTKFHGSEMILQRRAEGVVTPRGEALFRDQIALMKLLCQRHDIKLIWVDQVINATKVTDQQMKLFEKLRAILHDELRRQDIPLLQAHDRYDHVAAPMPDNVHFTDAGNAQLAKILAPQLFAVLQGSTLPKPAGEEARSGKESPRRP